jgi:hypothetical protein
MSILFRTFGWSLTALSLVAPAGAAPQQAPREYCSTDQFRSAATLALQVQREGFELRCREDLERFHISFGPLENATRKLAFTPVELAHTPFSGLKVLGGKMEFQFGVPSRLYRGFRTASGHQLTLLEHDMAADGSNVWRNPRDEPERINGLPARLAVWEDSSGAAFTDLSWVEGRRDYELWIDANVKKIAPLREQLFALAASLPRSIPGCPNEIPAEPARTGAPPAQSPKNARMCPERLR